MSNAVSTEAGKIETPEREYRAACVVCQDIVPVMLYPHRLDDRMVGWVFVCMKDAETIAGADIEILPQTKPARLGPNPDA